MSQKYARLLRDQDQVEHFLSDVLEMDTKSLPGIDYKIVQGEMGLIDLDIRAQTLDNTKFRDRNYKDEKSRWVLRQQIIDELLHLQRPADDDAICLGTGGALPLTSLASAKQAFLLIGLPASGKSGIANLISDAYKAIILDSDFAKRKLPEYANYMHGATVVHEESSQIVFNFKDNPNNIESVWQTSLKSGHNLVIPKIGQNASSILQLTEKLTDLGYQVHLTLVSLLKREATIRAVHRFYETKRYVPLGLIFDGYGNDPCLTYHLLKNRMPERFVSFGAISTNVPKGDKPFSIDLTKGNPAEQFEYRKNVLI